MKKASYLLNIFFGVLLSACSSPNECSQSDAYNKMMALGRAQARIIASGSESAGSIVSNMTVESGAISEMIAAGKYQEACAKADQIAKANSIDLASEMKGMLTIEQLAKDGGKGTGICSMAEAAQRQMEIHQLLQARVDSGKVDSDIFRRFSDDTAKFGEQMYTDPSAVCRKLEELKKSYGL